MSTPKPEVFISFANRDGECFAEAVRVRLQRESPALLTWKDHVSLEGGSKWWDQIQQALDQVRFLVLIVTPCVLHEELAPVVQKELRYARQQGVWIYPVMGAPKDEIPFDKFPRWLEKLTKTTFYDFRPAWPSPWDQPPPGHDYQFTYEWVRFVRQLDAKDRPPCVRNTAPTDLPENYVQRPEFDRLKALLLRTDAEGRREPVSITTSLRGAGGFGKTTLAKALCLDEQIREAFDDGILWVTLGEHPDLRAALAKLHDELTGETSAFKDAEQARQALRPRLEQRDLLILIDDAWSPDHVTPFLDGAPTVARLITTRETSVAARARPPGAEARPGVESEPWVNVDEPEPEVALEMLLAGLPRAVRPVVLEQGPFRSLAVDRLGRWPLLINLIAAELALHIHEGDTLTQALDLINRGLDEVGLLAFEPLDTPERRERSAELTIQASLKRLPADLLDKYEALAIFPEDRSIPCSTLRALWGISGFQAERFATELGRRSLLKYDSATRTVRLHDVFRAYLVRLHTNSSSLHSRLIDGWGDPRQLPDAYAWRHYAHHLAAAGRLEELKTLLLDYTWLKAKLKCSDAIALRDDAARFSDDRDFRLLARALEQSAHILAKDPAALRGQLYGRLMGISSPVLEEFLKQIRVVADEGAWLRPLQPGLTPADSPLVRTFQIPGRGLTVLALTSDGRWAVSGSIDGAVRLWDLQGQESRELGRHGSGVRSVALTSDGRWAVSGSYDGAVRLWDLQGQQSRELGRHGSWVISVALTSDGRWAVSGSFDGAVRLWDLQGQESRELGRHGSGVRSVALTSDGRWAVSGSYDGAVRLWDLQGQASRELGRHGSGVSSVALTWDGRWAVSGSYDGAVRLWDLQGQASRELGRHGSGVSSVALTSDGRWAVSGSDDGAVRLWDLQGQDSRELGRHGSGVISVALTSDGRWAVSGSFDGAVRLWDLQGQESRELGRHGSWVNSVALTWDGRWAVSGSIDGAVRLWDLQGQQSRELGRHGSGVSSVALTSDGRWAVSGSQDGAVRLWDLQGQESRELGRHGSGVSSVALTSDGRWAVSGSYDCAVRLWDLQGQESRELGRHGSWVSSVALTSDGRWAVSGSFDGAVRLWDLQGQESRELGRHGSGVGSLALTSDGRWAVSGSYDGAVRLWDLQGQASRELGRHGSGVSSVALTWDGRWAVSGSYDGAVRLWDCGKRELVAVFHADAAVTGCALSSDGSILVAGDAQGSVHLLKREERVGEQEERR